MRLTEFWRRMERTFGQQYAHSYAADMVLAELGSRTVNEALAQGEDTLDVWRAVVRANENAAATGHAVPATEK